MFRFAVLGLGALIPDVARADVGLSLRHVPVHVILTVDQDYPEFAFFLVDSERKTVQRVSPTVADPVIAKSGDVVGSYFVCEVYVVPKTELSEFEQSLPPAKWFEGEVRSKFRAGQIHVRPILDVFDNRERIEKTYRLYKLGDAFRVDLHSVNRGNPWVHGARVGLCCGLPGLAMSVTITLAGLWVVRRYKRKRSD